LHNDFQEQEADSILIKKSLRSGQRIKFPGNIIVQGDINPGAEVIADGNIIVMGTLWGVVHAGAKGDKNASILAFQLKPTQIRISDHFTRPPDNISAKMCFEPEIAFIKNGKVVIEKYDSIK
jgi:septum site-determining protein MinC